LKPRTLLIAISLLAACFAAAEAGTPRRSPPPPMIEPAGGEYPLNARVTVVIRAEAGAELVYTLDGTAPGPANGVRVESGYEEISLPPRDVVIRAAAMRPGLPPGGTRQAVFTRR
jgi:hypothetical protein